MGRRIVTFRIRQQEAGNWEPLLQFLQKAKATMQEDEDAEFVITCEPETGIFHMGITKLTPTEQYDPNQPYEVTPGEFIWLQGVVDEENDNGGSIRIYPPRS